DPPLAVEGDRPLLPGADRAGRRRRNRLGMAERGHPRAARRGVRAAHLRGLPSRHRRRHASACVRARDPAAAPGVGRPDARRPAAPPAPPMSGIPSRVVPRVLRRASPAAAVLLLAAILQVRPAVDAVYPISIVMSRDVGLFHWVDSIAGTSGGKTIP